MCACVFVCASVSVGKDSLMVNLYYKIAKLIKVNKNKKVLDICHLCFADSYASWLEQCRNVLDMNRSQRTPFLQCTFLKLWYLFCDVMQLYLSSSFVYLSFTEESKEEYNPLSPEVSLHGVGNGSGTADSRGSISFITVYILAGQTRSWK